MKWILRLLSTLVVGGAAWAAFIIVHLFISGQENPQAEGDVAIVLGAAVYTDTPSPVFKERIRHGITLYKTGRVSAIIFTGGLAQGDIISESEAAKLQAVSSQVPERDIFIESQSTNTFENVRYARDIMNANQFDQAVIVSDPHHLKRASLYANQLGVQHTLDPTPTTRYRGVKTRLVEIIKEGYLITRFWWLGY